MIDVILGSWAAGETKTFHVNGSYFEILECAYAIDVKLLDRNGAVRSDMRKAEASFYSQGLEFATIQITSDTAQVIRSFYGDGTAGTRRMSGVVQVVDGGKSRSLAAKAFIGNVSGGIPAAGKYAQAALWNPPGSNVNLILKAVTISANVAVGCNNKKITAELVSNNGGVFSKNLGLTDLSNGQMLYDIVTLVAPVPTAIFQVSVQANGMGQYPLQEPIIITPGVGFCLIANSPATQVVTTFEWFEDSF